MLLEVIMARQHTKTGDSNPPCFLKGGEEWCCDKNNADFASEFTSSLSGIRYDLESIGEPFFPFSDDVTCDRIVDPKQRSVGVVPSRCHHRDVNRGEQKSAATMGDPEQRGLCVDPCEQ
ncbi:hypothetical protein CEXT_639511 [Caerostris extrusa]|uniref:Uncharacterized protein n=1 Tax=Caerostris extrusa TaxID=172846 RepID=A0AAV4QNJ1_CAEEX|nr:hypothetical protein CEXT_639511 [Caerostris extrusa]